MNIIMKLAILYKVQHIKQLHTSHIIPVSFGMSTILVMHAITFVVVEVVVVVFIVVAVMKVAVFVVKVVVTVIVWVVVVVGGGWGNGIDAGGGSDCRNRKSLSPDFRTITSILLPL